MGRLTGGHRDRVGDFTGNRPRSALASAAAPFTKPSASRNLRGNPGPPEGEVEDRALGPASAVWGTASSPIVSRSRREAVSLHWRATSEIGCCRCPPGSATNTANFRRPGSESQATRTRYVAPVEAEGLPRRSGSLARASTAPKAATMGAAFRTYRLLIAMTAIALGLAGGPTHTPAPAPPPVQPDQPAAVGAPAPSSAQEAIDTARKMVAEGKLDDAIRMLAPSSRCTTM